MVANQAPTLHVSGAHPGVVMQAVAGDNPTRAQIAARVASARAGQRDLVLDANPALVSLSAQLVTAQDDELQLRFQAPASSAQGNGVVGGGTLASMLDLAMAMAVLSRLPPGQTCATISLTVNMMAAAQVGAVLATATVERIGRRVAFARAVLLDPSGNRMLASASSSLSLFEERNAG